MMQDPTILIGCMVWLPVGIWTISMIQWMITGDVDPLVGILSIGIGLVLGGYTMMTKDTHLRPYFVIAAMSMVIFYPILNKLKNDRENSNLDLEIMERAYEQLGSNPKHLGAQFRIARTLQMKGHLEEAVALLRRTTEGLPKRLIEPEVRTLRQWEA
ncbi:MAG: tetratricopeptide repeat protein, partial [Fimbriimonadaceae bacterium]